jgi:hypothetical protein
LQDPGSERVKDPDMSPAFPSGALGHVGIFRPWGGENLRNPDIGVRPLD